MHCISVEIIPFLTTLFAAFLGAWFAFLFQNRRENRKEENINVAALNKVQINLIQQLNVLTILHKDFIKPYQNNAIKWLATPAAPYRDYSYLRIDVGSIIFLAEKGFSPLISEILLTEETFQEAMKILNLRSEVHINRLQPKLEALGFKEGVAFESTQEEFEKNLGDRLTIELKRLTEGVVGLTEDSITLHEDTISKLKSAGETIFPNKKVLSFEYTPKDSKEKS